LVEVEIIPQEKKLK